MDTVTVWLGMDVDPVDPEALKAIEHFYRGTFLREMEAANPILGQGHRYELLSGGPSRSHGPSLVTTFELREEQAAMASHLGQTALSLATAPAAWREAVTLRWTLTYRRLGETGPALTVPYAIYLVGVDPPPGITIAQLEEFNEFYTNVHMPEVVERRHCIRAVRYARHREIDIPAETGPQFLAVYELDERAAATKRHIGGAYAPGPAVWRKHTTPWRLWYRWLPA